MCDGPHGPLEGCRFAVVSALVALRLETGVLGRTLAGAWPETPASPS